MTPKEKANDLIEKYCQVLFGNEQFVSLTNPRQCALIAVDELINSYNTYQNMYDQAYFSSECDYWQEVKQEINKL